MLFRSGPGGLHGGIHGQDIGLERDVLNGLDNRSNLCGGLIDVSGGHSQLPHFGVGLRGMAGGPVHQPQRTVLV